jgi:hypothetical protein
VDNVFLKAGKNLAAIFNLPYYFETTSTSCHSSPPPYLSCSKSLNQTTEILKDQNNSPALTSGGALANTVKTSPWQVTDIWALARALVNSINKD